ncbi:MAG TPA: hypothetical protein VH478_11575 [Trebonia sp.]|nr:hypothetical protein [Trebonia sp.]
MTDYEYLARTVGELPPGSAGYAAAATRTALARWAAGALREVADGTRPVRAVRHPLGFTCLPLERAAGDGVCVHLWSPRVERAGLTTSEVHAHCWELASYVLFGRLDNQVMVVGDAAGLHEGGTWPEGLYRVLDVRVGGDGDELVPTARFVHCVPGQRQSVATGDAYSLPAGAFHATDVPPGTETATIVLGRLVPGAPDWALGRPNSDPHRVRRRVHDAARTAAIARVILGRLLAATPAARD